MFYSSDPAGTRAFLRDQLGLSSTDVGGGWLIFPFAESEVGVHPAEAGDGCPAGTQQFSFYCDDLAQTMAELRGRGVEFLQEMQDTGWGLVTRLALPGGCEVQLYQPSYRVER